MSRWFCLLHSVSICTGSHQQSPRLYVRWTSINVRWMVVQYLSETPFDGDINIGRKMLHQRLAACQKGWTCVSGLSRLSDLVSRLRSHDNSCRSILTTFGFLTSRLSSPVAGGKIFCLKQINQISIRLRM